MPYRSRRGYKRRRGRTPVTSRKRYKRRPTVKKVARQLTTLKKAVYSAGELKVNDVNVARVLMSTNWSSTTGFHELFLAAQGANTANINTGAPNVVAYRQGNQIKPLRLNIVARFDNGDIAIANPKPIRVRLIVLHYKKADGMAPLTNVGTFFQKPAYTAAGDQLPIDSPFEMSEIMEKSFRMVYDKTISLGFGTTALTSNVIRLTLKNLPKKITYSGAGQNTAVADNYYLMAVTDTLNQGGLQLSSRFYFKDE